MSTQHASQAEPLSSRRLENADALHMYMVYWLIEEEGRQQAQAQAFDSDALKEALAFMESLRARQRAGEPLGFVTMCSENPHSVGSPGVAETGPDYNWKKRRR